MIKVLIVLLACVEAGSFILEGDCYNTIDFGSYVVLDMPYLPMLSRSGSKEFDTLESTMDWLNQASCSSTPHLFLKREILIEQVKVGSKMEEKQVTVRKRVVREVKKWYSNHSSTGGGGV